MLWPSKTTQRLTMLGKSKPSCLPILNCSSNFQKAGSIFQLGKMTTPSTLSTTVDRSYKKCPISIPIELYLTVDSVKPFITLKSMNYQLGAF